ncbi:hypothetical protein CEXT_368691, partial [Caerostris extrusa]
VCDDGEDGLRERRGCSPFREPPRPQPVDLSTDESISAQKSIVTEFARLLLYLKAIADIARTERFRKDLGSNSDVILDDLLEKKIQDLVHQRNGLEEQELHKALYILKEIVNMFTGASNVSTVFQQLNQAKSSEDKLFVLCNGFTNNKSQQTPP